MSLDDISSQDAVRQAMTEFDELGRDNFLDKYEFSRSRKYLVELDGKFYDSKALIGVAHKYQFPEKGPLSHKDFSGGIYGASKKLEELGFKIIEETLDTSSSTKDELIEIDTTLKYWFVNASWKGIDQTPRFLEENQWESEDKEESTLEQMQEMQVGDRIAIKKVRSRVNEYPKEFDTKGKKVSQLELKATGYISANNGNGRLEVEWDEPSEIKHWYYFTFQNEIWLPNIWDRGRDILGGRYGNWARRLIRFAFHQEQQDYAYWAKAWNEYGENARTKQENFSLRTLMMEWAEEWPSYAKLDKVDSKERAYQIITEEIPAAIREMLIYASDENEDVEVKGSTGMATIAKCPWVRLALPGEQKNVGTGASLGFLFSLDCKRIYLNIGLGTGGQSSPSQKKMAEIKNEAHILAESLEPKITEIFPDYTRLVFDEIDLASLGASRPRSYEQSNVVALEYVIADLPDDEILVQDLVKFVELERSLLYEVPKEEKQTTTGRSYYRIMPGSASKNLEECLENNYIGTHYGIKQDLTEKLALSKEEFLEEISLIIKEKEPDRSKSSLQHTGRQIFLVSKEMQNDDLVLMPDKKGNYLVGKVTGDYLYDENAELCHMRSIEWGEKSISRVDLSDDLRRIAYQNVTAVNLDKFSEEIEELLNETKPKADPYSISDIVKDGCFIPETTLHEYLERLKTKKNIILQGPPGTGKTWLAKKLGFALIGFEDEQLMTRVQFHPNLSYEDFIRGWRPVGEGKLELADGPLMNAINKAIETPDKNHVVVIEEVNRGNPAQIFGEMLTLLEADKRSSSEAMKLSYSHDPSETVYVPANLYLIGTMNIADRSLALVDLALRRRFAFLDLKPQFNQAWSDWSKEHGSLSDEFVNNIRTRINTLNTHITESPALGAQFVVGHSYLTPHENRPISDSSEWFRQVVTTEIKPLLEEYWFDQSERAEDEVKLLLEGF